MMHQDAANKPREKVIRRPSEVGGILDEMMGRALAKSGDGLPSDALAEEAGRLDAEGDMAGAIRARLAWRAAHRRERG